MLRYITIVTLLCGSVLLCSAQTLRLVGGDNDCEGRVEIQRDDDVFAQYCDGRAGDNEAMVICRQLSCSATGAVQADPVELVALV